MNSIEFSKIFQGLPVFSIKDIEKRYPGFERENLLNWQKKGYLLRIRNGWYSHHWVQNRLNPLISNFLQHRNPLHAICNGLLINVLGGLMKLFF